MTSRAAQTGRANAIVMLKLPFPLAGASYASKRLARLGVRSFGAGGESCGASCRRTELAVKERWADGGNRGVGPLPLSVAGRAGLEALFELRGGSSWIPAATGGSRARVSWGRAGSLAIFRA